MPEPYDDPNIGDEDRIIRRIAEHHLTPDENFGDTRISSQAFKPSSDGSGLSVDIEQLILADGKDPREWLITPPFIGAVSFPAAAARGHGCRIGYDPIKNHPTLPDNPYHGAVWGPAPTPHKISNGTQKALLRKSTWYVEIPHVAIR